MDLATYIADSSRRSELVAALGCNDDYLWQVATGWRGRKAGPKLAKRIEHATSGAVTRREVRPDLYDDATQPAKGEAA